MKQSVILSLGLAALSSAHCIFQNLKVNGADQGSLVALRAPNSNNPVQDVTSSGITCGNVASQSSQVVTVPAGAQVGAWWQHVIGGAQFPNDPDNPIAASHKGPITAWLAKVDNAASASHSGQKWFKIAEDNLDTSTGKWGVDRMIENGGWSYFTVPSCIAPGQYLLRVELLALHSAGSPNGAQFYTSCAQIQITGSGTFTPSQTQSFPGAYSQNDASILTSIYGSSGKPDNGGKAYQAPGMRPIAC
jgi:cellulase